MSSATVLSTCEEAGMVPFCAENSQQQECFSPGESIEKVMDASLCAPANFSVNTDCFPLDYVFAYGDGGQAEVLKADNSTGEVVWQKTTVEGLSGQIGKNFYALCQYLIPTTTTTTTTTTMAPTTLSREGVKQHLTRTECPLIQQTENHDSDSETQDGLPEIDLFLNPGRKGELEELELWVEKNEENMTYTEVRHIYGILLLLSLRILFRESIRTSSDCCGTRCPPVSPPTTTQTPPTCSAGAPGWGRTSTARRSSLLSSLIRAFVALLTCRITLGILSSAGWCKLCRNHRSRRGKR